MQSQALKKVVARTRELTSKPFGVAIVLAFPYEDILKHIYSEKIAFLQVYYGDFPKARVDEAHAAGVKVLHQVPLSRSIHSSFLFFSQGDSIFGRLSGEFFSVSCCLPLFHIAISIEILELTTRVMVDSLVNFTLFHVAIIMETLELTFRVTTLSGLVRDVTLRN